MISIKDYRKRAEAQRRAAEISQLPMVRQRHLDAARRLDELADEKEQMLRRTAYLRRSDSQK